jgi:enoyl-CoA hydratase/carnithine racemase
MSETPYVTKAARDGVVTLTLDRGERYNPLSRAMIAALDAELEAVAGGPDARVVVLAAAGKGFSAGHDLKELRAHAGDEKWQRELFAACSRMMQRITEIPQPVVARVHGIATAAGCQLVSMCDLAVASSEARFALPGVNVGIFCTTPAVGVARNVHRKHAMEMLLTGALVGADVALARGLVNAVVPPAELDAAVARYTDAIAARSAAVIAAGKRAFYRQVELSLVDAYALADGAMVDHLGLDDAAEGIDAFLEKRPPVWKGR